MCGIVGMIGTRPAAPVLLDALRRLEYRGYDSAGIATLVNGHIERRRASGKLINLAAVLDHESIDGSTGIGHTRWATHGAPTETNAHPHGTSRVALVHNGIIENHAALRAELMTAGRLHPSIAANLNGDEFVKDPGTVLSPEDRLLILSADAGG